MRVFCKIVGIKRVLDIFDGTSLTLATALQKEAKGTFHEPGFEPEPL